MQATRSVAAIGFVVFSLSVVHASEPAVEPVPVRAEAAVERVAHVSPRPWVHSKVRPVLGAKIEAGFAIAVQRVRDNAGCQALFSGLGSDGVEMLHSSLYFAMPTTFDGRSICERAHAATFVGEPTTFVCRRFQWLSDEQAAMVLIHEALHHAGLTEFPQDPEAMSSGRITRMVERSCGP